MGTNVFRSGAFYFEPNESDGTCVLVGTKYDSTSYDTRKNWPDTIKVPAEVKGYRVTGISRVFRYCDAKKIVLPDTLTVINDCFVECHLLEELDIPDSVTRIIGRDTFNDCEKLVEEENGFSYVDNWVVDSNRSALLTTLRPGTVGSAEGVNLLSLAVGGNITLPDDFYYLGYYAFSDPYSGKSTFEGTITINCLKRNDFAMQNMTVGCVVVKDSVSDLSGLLYKADIRELVIGADDVVNMPVTQTKIGKLTLTDGRLVKKRTGNYGCELPAAELVIGREVTGVDATLTSSTLQKIVVESESTEIAEGVFLQCRGVQEISGPASLLAAVRAEALTSITVTSGTVTAEMLASAPQLKSLTVGVGVTVEAGAFAAASALESVAVPLSALDSLPKAAIKELTILDGTAIAAEALAGFTALESVTLPKTVTAIGADAFLECTALKSVYFGGTVGEWATIRFANGAANPLSRASALYIDGALVTEATGLAALSPYAFYGYAALNKVTLADSLTKIPTAAFAGCTGLTSLSLPAAMQEIGAFAFADCTALDAVTFPHTDNWVRYETATAGEGNTVPAHYLTDPARAADYLADTYALWVWRRLV